jgi:beta-lactamase regulating signal transducer with metallopeptidase domain
MAVERVVSIVLEGALLAAFVALLCALVPRLKAAHRALLWWLVSVKLLVGLAPLPVVHVAALPALKSVASTAKVEARSAAAVPAAQTAESAAVPSRTSIAVLAWLTGVTLLASAAIPGWLRIRRHVRSGRAPDEDGWRLAAARAAIAAGLRRVPRVLVVADLETPLVTGFFHPTVLMPRAALEHMTPDELEMTLAHEMAHLARGDLWLGLVPALARHVFFFHPAAWIAEREYAIAREAACDEIVLDRGGADAFAYGRLLLAVATRRAAPSAIPMSRHSMLRRRLLMIDAVVRRAPIGRAGWALVALAALAIVPVRLQAREAGDRRCLDIGADDETAYVVTDGRTHTMCGDLGDVRLAEEQRAQGEDLIWLRVGNQDWVVRDRAVVAEGRRLFRMVAEVGAQQAEIGGKQSSIGAQQSKIGMEQGEIGMRQAEIALKQAAVDMRRAELARANGQLAENDAARQDRVRLEREIEEREAQLQQVENANRDARSAEESQERMRELGTRMEALGAEQDVYGEQQRVLGERMEREVAEAQQALSLLLQRAMRDGTALKVK